MLILLVSGHCSGASGHCSGASGHCATLCWYVLVVKLCVARAGCGLLPALEDAHGAVKGIVQPKAMVHLGDQGILDAHDCQVDCRQQGRDLQQRPHSTMLHRGSDVMVDGSLLSMCLLHGMATTGQHRSHTAQDCGLMPAACRACVSAAALSLSNSRPCELGLQEAPSVA